MSADSTEFELSGLKRDVADVRAHVDAIDGRLHGVESDLKVLLAVSPTYATKEDVLRLSVEIHKEFNLIQKEFTAQMRQFIGWLFVLAGVVLAAVKYLL